MRRSSSRERRFFARFSGTPFSISMKKKSDGMSFREKSKASTSGTGQVVSRRTRS